MAKERTTKTTDINVTAREVDFVSRFGMNWQGLMDILGITRPIRKAPGTVLKSKIGSVVLENSVAEGEEIPYSKATVIEKDYGEIEIEKYSKGITLEAINEHGYDVAISRTDKAFLNELQKKVTNRFYSYLSTGLLTNRQNSFRSALAMAKGYSVEKFRSMSLDATDVVAFVNTIDFYSYLGGNDAGFSIQTEFGLTYVKNFMGYSTIFLCSDNEVARGTVIATPVENIVLYYVDPSDSEFARAGLDYRVDGVTNLIGFHVDGNYNTAVSESFAILGMILFAEYLNGIAVVNFNKADFDTLTVNSSAASSVSGATKIVITEPVYDNLPADVTYYFKAGATEPSVTYKEVIDVSQWTPLTIEKFGSIASADNIKPEGLAASQKAVVIGVNGTGQAIAKGSIASVTVKS